MRAGGEAGRETVEMSTKEGTSMENRETRVSRRRPGEQVTLARKYMGRIWEAKKRVWELTRRLEVCDAILSRAGTALGDEKRPGGGASALEEGVRAVERLRESLGEELEGYAARVREAERAIDQLEDESEREALRLRYLCGEDYERMAERMHYCDGRYMRKKCASALGHLRF